MTEKDDRFKVSWSSLQRHELCRQKHFLTLEGHKGVGQDVRNFLAGNIVDSIQKAWLDAPVGNMADMVAEHMDKSIAESEERGTIKWRNKNDKSNIFKSCVQAATALQPILETRVLPYEYEPAKRFYTPAKIRKPDGEVTEIILRGEFDLLVRDKEGRFVVWDLKTTADNSYWKKTLGQLVFYDLVVYNMFGQPPVKTGFIQPLCDEQVKEFYFDDSHRAQMWGRIHTMMQAIWVGDYTPKPDNAGCSFCEVNHACAKFKRKLFS